MPNHRNKWVYAVTTVPQRRKLLGRTLKSLESGGFVNPLLCCDKELSPLGVYGNWIIAAWTIYMRSPIADRYAIFQDDILCVHNLRQYLDRVEYPQQGYWNLYLAKVNEQDGVSGFYSTSQEQRGRGACALVFDNNTLRTLLSSRILVDWPRISACSKPGRRIASIDGRISDSLRPLGIMEHVHSPQLVQHADDGYSTLGHQPFEQSEHWLGEEFDALCLSSG